MSHLQMYDVPVEVRSALDRIETELRFIAKAWDPFGTTSSNSARAYDCHCVAAQLLNEFFPTLAQDGDT